ncbi:MAG: C40 family peptidase [Oscillospiraceae bacterium]|nr:C40 family peptidase [Oscillospiraceae bacterium]
MTGTRSWGLRILCLVLSLVCVFTTLSPVAATAEQAPEELEMIYTSLIYRGASAGSRVIGRMEDGTVLSVLDYSGAYYKIDCYDSTGYIAASQVKQRENGEYYISCDPDAAHTAQMETRLVGDALLLRSAILELAKAQLGDPYVYGATGPNAFDCSGFTSYLYKNNGYTLARICDDQMAQGVIVSRDGLQVGDLILFGPSLGNVTHVGIYAGDGQMIHAGSGGICYADLDSTWCTQNYLCARRIITVGDQITQLAPAAAADSLLTRGAGTSIRSVR